jgi:hypothetical protein
VKGKVYIYMWLLCVDVDRCLECAGCTLGLPRPPCFPTNHEPRIARATARYNPTSSVQFRVQRKQLCGMQNAASGHLPLYFNSPHIHPQSGTGHIACLANQLLAWCP